MDEWVALLCRIAEERRAGFQVEFIGQGRGRDWQARLGNEYQYGPTAIDALGKLVGVFRQQQENPNKTEQDEMPCRELPPSSRTLAPRRRDVLPPERMMDGFARRGFE